MIRLDAVPYIWKERGTDCRNRYLRCHDDIGWGLDFEWLAQNCGVEEKAHKRFLSEWFQGRFAGSVSRGELYNNDFASGDARQCDMSLCGAV